MTKNTFSLQIYKLEGELTSTKEEETKELGENIIQKVNTADQIVIDMGGVTRVTEEYIKNTFTDLPVEIEQRISEEKIQFINLSSELRDGFYRMLKRCGYRLDYTTCPFCGLLSKTVLVKDSGTNITYLDRIINLDLM